ncbi:MAG: hypothetical protein R2882_00855 [Gemmatimonadales bacterium]
MAQPFAPGMIAPALVERAGRLELMATAPGSSPFVTRVDRASSADSSRISYAVADIFAQQTTLATATVSRAEFRGAEQRIQLIVLLGIVVLGALGWVSYRTARGAVRRSDGGAGPVAGSRAVGPDAGPGHRCPPPRNG